MQHIKTRDELFESDMSSLFKDLHAPVDVKSIVPLLDVAGKPGLPSKSDVSDLIAYLEVDGKNLFYNPKAIINRFMYIDGPTYIVLHDVSVKGAKMMRTKEAINHVSSRMKELLDAGDYVKLFMLMDKPMLLPVFTDIYRKIPSKHVYDIFVSLYTRSEYGFSGMDRAMIEYVFSKRTMSSRWKTRMKKLPAGDEITVYRGQTKDSTAADKAFSWTTSMKTAKFFAGRFDSAGKVETKTVRREDIVDYIDERGEKEIILLPKIV